MDILSEIKKEHENFRKITDEISKTTSRAEKTREKKFKKLKDDVKAHHESEEYVLFPDLKNHTESKEITLEGIEEHKVIHYLLDEIDKIKTTDETFSAKFSVFKEILEHHMDEEEKDLFEKARKVLSKDKLEEMKDSFESKKTIEK
ncbi:hemerythrin domain-containing protein [Clostridium algidicarnis]|uniref:hemerythrin domain-containing protein n=1 Tax=Clostridium algidicarnis TaxID=37659 RepID=UPI003FD6F096